MKRLSICTLSVFIVFICSLGYSHEAHAQQSKKITLAGYKHNPPVRTSGVGTATVTLHGDTLIVKGKFKNLSGNYSGAHIMVSLRGEGGNQLYRLKVNLNDNKTGGKLEAKENRFVLSKTEKQLLKKGDLYLNISSFEHQRGELRGNIGPLGK